MNKSQNNFKALTDLYGEFPSRPDHLYVRLISSETSQDGLAVLEKYELISEYGENKCSFEFTSLLPESVGKCRTFIEIKDKSELQERFYSESFRSYDLAIFEVLCDSVCPLNADIRSGVGRVLLGKRRKKNAPGKFAIYAWAISRVMDYVLTLNELDSECTVLKSSVGLSDAALLAVSCDSRFRAVEIDRSPCDHDGRDLFGAGKICSYSFDERLKRFEGIADKIKFCVLHK